MDFKQVEFSVKQSLFKALKYVFIFGLPNLLMNWLNVNHPDILGLTIGGALVIIINYIKVKVLNIP